MNKSQPSADRLADNILELYPTDSEPTNPNKLIWELRVKLTLTRITLFILLPLLAWFLTPRTFIVINRSSIIDTPPITQNQPTPNLN
jgi:hypothetical protein